MDVVRLNPIYAPNDSKGKPVGLGTIYIGEPDTDPTVALNQKTIYVLEEDSSITQVAQPLTMGAGGVPLYNGDPVTILTNGNYSLTILDSAGSQVYYVPSDQSINEKFPTVATLTALKALSVPGSDGYKIYLLGRSSTNDGGQGIFAWDSSDLSTEVTADSLSGIYVPPDSDNTGASGAWIRQVGSKQYNVAWFGLLDAGDISTDAAALISFLSTDTVGIIFPGNHTYTFSNNTTFAATTTATFEPGCILAPAAGKYVAFMGATKFDPDDTALYGGAGSVYFLLHPEVSHEDTTLTVGLGNGLPTDFTTIQAAINAVPRRLKDSYEIEVEDGTYHETLIISGIMIDPINSGSSPWHNLQVTGDTTTPANVEIDAIYIEGCTGVLNPVVRGFTILAQNAAGFAYYPLGDYSSIVVAGTHNANVSDLIITGNPNNTDTAILAYGGTTLDVYDVDFGTGENYTAFLAKHESTIRVQAGITGTVSIIANASNGHITFRDTLDLVADGTESGIFGVGGTPGSLNDGTLYDSEYGIMYGIRAIDSRITTYHDFFYADDHYIDLDTGTGASTFHPQNGLIMTPTAGGDTAGRQCERNDSIETPTWATARRFVAKVRINTLANTQYIGMGEPGVAHNFVGFKVTGGAFYSCIVVAGVETTSVIAGVGTASSHVLEAFHTPTGIRFFVDNVFKSQDATHIPSGTTDAIGFMYGITTNSGADASTLIFYEWHFEQF